VLPPKSRLGGVICYGGIGIGLRGLSILAQKRLKLRLNKRLRAGLTLALLGTAAVTLAACGRAGPLEPPPGPAVGVAPSASAAPAAAPASLVGPPAASGPVSPEAAQKNGFDAYGNPVAPPGQKKSFPLDFLLQ
jgi:predicted small lipoprotein YifL